jgi:hypothetical protein
MTTADAPTLPAAALDAKATARDALVRHWDGRVLARIQRGLDDAEAHARAAVTLALKAEPEGRATARRARRSRSSRAALSRLGELGDALAGPTLLSLDGLIRAGWQQAMELAFDRWTLILGQESVRPAPWPTAAELRAMRRHTIDGLELRQEIGAPIDRIARQLLAAIAQAGARATPESAGLDGLAAWRRRAEGVLWSACDLALRHGAVFADAAAGYLVLRPDLRAGEPPMAA